MTEFKFYIRRKKDLIDAVNELGFVPLFTNSIEGFSVEEHVAPSAWFSGEEGVWEWKGPVIKECGCAYGKFFENKAVFISRKFFPDFANYRRNGYDFDARFDDGLASFRDKDLFELIDEHSPVLSKKLKRIGNYGKDGKKGFETIITRLQSQCYVVTSDFKYETTKEGKTYGWGVAEYSTPEKLFGSSFAKKVYAKSPEASYKRIFAQLKKILPWADESEIKKILK